MISAIVAVDNNWGIGYNGNLLLSIPDDLKRFKAITTGHNVVMGKNTWESLPKKPLPNRINIVIDYRDTIDYLDDYIIGNLEDISNMIKFSIEKDPNIEFFIIGGGSIYKQLLPLCDRVYLTKIYHDFENVDTFFPNLDATGDWISAPVGELQDHNDISYQYWVYDRIS
jgi:dihydrofolate reductase